MEKKVNELLEASAFANAERDYAVALEKAKEAGKKERQLWKHREQAALMDTVNIDLTYSVCFNLANQYHANGQYSEALNTYSMIVKNKQYSMAGRLRVNMGNIYFEQRKYPQAIKMYRMSLDQINNTEKVIRHKIMRNIGIAHIRMGQFQEAIHSYETIMESYPDFHTGFNLVVCYYALGDKEKMKKGFVRLCSIALPGSDADDDDVDASDENVVEDELKQDLRERQKEATNFIKVAAQLIAPTIEKDFVTGYDFVVENLRAAHYTDMGNEMEISKALHYLKEHEYEKAIETLKSFEKKNEKLLALAATNLSFLYYLEGDFHNADKYANVAIRTERYNARALVNKGNCLVVKGELEKAKELYMEAIGVEADCMEAMYNLGIVNKRLGCLDEALQAFEKLQSIIPDSIQVIFHIAMLFDMMNQHRQAIKWLSLLVARMPTDPGILSRLGAVYSKDEDETQAYHYHLESYRFYPVDMDVLSWLGAYYVKNEMYEKAIEYFHMASQIQPQEVKWQLMVASCHRRIGAYQQALKIYQAIHKDHPENIECLNYLVRLCRDLGMKDQIQEYAVKLNKAERAREQAAAQAKHEQYQEGYEDAGLDNYDASQRMNSREPRMSDLQDTNKTSVQDVINKKKASKQKDEDDWGDEELGDDLLPM
jgi:intraflagellar transport protein 88